MFGLFKNSTNEGKLENHIKESMEKQIANYVRKTEGNKFLTGTAIDSATRDVYSSFMTTTPLLAKGHGISYEKTLTIISKTTNEVRNNYLVHPMPI